MGRLHIFSTVRSFVLLATTSLLVVPSLSGLQTFKITPPFNGTQMNWIDKDGLFLLSPNSTFAFGFVNIINATSLFHLSVVHQQTATTVWTANTDSPATSSDPIVFSTDGDVYLMSSSTHNVTWSSNTKGKGATSMELRDTGNLVVLGRGSVVLWQSFDYPTDTLLPGQNFTAGMKLVSQPNDQNLTFTLAFDSGDVVLRAGFRSPQQYWSIWTDGRQIDNAARSDITVAAISGNSWSFYDRKQTLLTQVRISFDGSADSEWAAVLQNRGMITFTDLTGHGQSSNIVPKGYCDVPEPCNPYSICSQSITCSCPVALISLGLTDCNPSMGSCTGDNSATDLVEVGNVGYFAIRYEKPTLSHSSLQSCQSYCKNNCSCAALFFDQRLNNCFTFEEIGSLQKLGSQSSSSNISCYLKVSSTNNGRSLSGGGGSKTTTIVVTISVLTAFVVALVLYIAFHIHRKRNASLPEQPLVYSSDDDGDIMSSISGMPVRYTYAELHKATNGFADKLGQGGFGCVYAGTLPDGSRVAVKKLEGIGQGKKEFRAEVTIIGSIHHHYLVKLRGFCSEGSHRLLAYEYMSNGSLDKWIFPRRAPAAAAPVLDWDTRYAIAVGTAKGLAYLHEGCDSKIIHCDIKPENVLLDDNFIAKVSDFGLAKLMNREQSHVFTTLRGTRGYLAPEWIISSAISEKSDVYSFGMVLLEIIGGRKNFDSNVSSEKSHFPSYCFKMMEEGRLKEIVDSKLNSGKESDERVENAVKVALWCIQEDVTIRPSMGKVVQMLEGVAEVPQPPLSSQMGYRLYANAFKSESHAINKMASSSSWSSAQTSDYNSDALMSAVRLSGPR